MLEKLSGKPNFSNTNIIIPAFFIFNGGT